MRYSVILIPNPDGQYSVEVPALPGCLSCGRTREEALANVRDAIGLYIEALKEDGEPIPVEHHSTLTN